MCPLKHFAGESASAWLLSSHDIDLIRWYFGSEPVEARAWGRKKVLAARGIPTYDIIQVRVQVRFASGAIATYESAWIYPTTFHGIVDSIVEIIGEGRHIHMDRKYESIEVSTSKSFTYTEGFLNCDIFGRAGRFLFLPRRFPLCDPR
ncbi:MAG: Gfo/Idh/MocA family oxidoreductase [Acidobacteria bacterium]|nr:Gfo/Idh/MocA family oxidoreductase [Acidobacteriota bacterium]